MGTTKIYTTSCVEKYYKKQIILTVYYPQITALIKNTLIATEKLNSRELYSFLVYIHPITPTSQKYLAEYLKLTAWTGNRSIYYHVW